MPARAIPIQNVYYLLAYAWDLFRPGEEVEVAQSECPDAHNLLALILSRGIRRLATRGMDKAYRLDEDETPRLRGRVQVMRSYRRLTHISGRMICEFDEMTADTLPNQILKATCQRLLQYAPQLTRANRHEVRGAFDLLDDISDLGLTRKVFYRVQLHRNNRHYRLLMDVSRLLFELYLPEERDGTRRFRELLDEETVMARIFERFVLRFAKRHCPTARV